MILPLVLALFAGHRTAFAQVDACSRQLIAADSVTTVSSGSAARSRTDAAIEALAQRVSLTAKIIRSDSNHSCEIRFFDASQNQTGGLTLVRAQSGSANLSNLVLPKFSSQTTGAVDAEKFLSSLVRILVDDAKAAGYRELSFAPYEKWNKGNSAFLSLGFKKSADGLLRRDFPTPSIAEKIQTAEKKTAFFNQVADILEKNKKEIESILSAINTPEGTAFEFEQSIDALRNAEHIELFNLQNSKTLNHAAVYASTNVPLYTLVVHGLIPASISKNVWFRTPERTRGIYQRLYDLIFSNLDLSFQKGLHLLTENRDTQYDSFRKTYILGLNSNGNFQREPSEIVIFVGSPKTSETIQNQIRNEISKTEANRAVKLVFISYGAGMNPMIVTESAGKNIERAVDATIENISINCAQDCSVPKLYAVHKKVAAKFKKSILEKIRKQRPEDYRSLSMTKDFSRLVQYRAKYQARLANPEALLKPETQQASPHLFEFSVADLRELDLQEHFAPFITLLTYETDDELLSIARDERMQQQAMFAEVFGSDQATHDLNRARDIFKEQGHLVWVNRNLFSMESANMPFGGAGVDTSAVITFQKKKGSPVVVTRGHYPTLFSQEAFQHFAKAAAAVHAPSQPPEFYQKRLEETLRQAHDRSFKVDKPAWKDFEPNFDAGLRPRGIAALQEIARKRGVKKFYSGYTLSREESKIFDRWQGTKMVGPGREPKKQVDGVMIHALSIGENLNVMNRVRGEVNPFEGYANLAGILDLDKRIEYEVAEAIYPGIMPRTETLSQLREAKQISTEFETKRLAALAQVREWIERKQNLSKEERSALQTQPRDLVESLFVEVRKIFPEGAYFKNFGEFASGDLGNSVTTFAASSKHIADEFLRRVERAISDSRLHFAKKSSQFDIPIPDDAWEIGSLFVKKLLLAHETIVAQQRVVIDKTELGYPFEMRIDFVDGEAVIGRTRFSLEYQPEAIEKASSIINEFFKRAPEEFRYLSGGADVARLSDGRWVVIEFNFGPYSGTLAPEYYPIESHQYVSILQGQKTAFLKELEAVYQAGQDARIKKLKSLKHIRSVWWRHEESEASVEDIGRYFRDRMLQDWAAQGADPSQAQATLDAIRSLFAAYEIEPVKRLIESAEHYVRRTLSQPATPASTSTD